MKIVAALALAAATSAQALEPFGKYDNFDQPPINMTRWTDSERVRQIRDEKLRLMQRSVGADNFNLGSTSFFSWNENMPNQNAITAIRARVRVNALEVNACPSTTFQTGQSRARILGTFFNSGLPFPGTGEPGSLSGDVLAQVRIVRRVNSLDPVGVMRVEGSLNLCTSFDCNSATPLGQIELGTVALGHSITVQMEWDKPSQTFYFSRDAGAFSGSVTYLVRDALPPSLPLKQLSTRVDITNCPGGALAAVVDATFDRVSVNQSAAP